MPAETPTMSGWAAETAYTNLCCVNVSNGPALTASWFLRKKYGRFRTNLCREASQLLRLQAVSMEPMPKRACSDRQRHRTERRAVVSCWRHRSYSFYTNHTGDVAGERAIYEHFTWRPKSVAMLSSSESPGTSTFRTLPCYSTSATIGLCQAPFRV